MKKIFFPALMLIAVCLIDSCTSGKQAYQKGNYDEAVLKAISRLRKSPNNKKASQTLMESYPLTVSWHQDNINRAKQSNDDFKWERVVSEYRQINHLYDQLSRCPACLRVVSNPVNYVAELNDARAQAAAIRYQRGEELLARARTTRNRNEAIEAYRHFEVAFNMMGEYKDVRDKLEESRFMAILKVVVEPIPAHRNLEISHEFFENKILEFVESMQVNEFVEFYSSEEAKNIGLEQPDQIIQLQFDEFVLGQVFIKEREVQVSKDSVVLAVIKAQNQIEQSDALVLAHSRDKKDEYLKYLLPTPIIASPELEGSMEQPHSFGISKNFLSPVSANQDTTITTVYSSEETDSHDKKSKKKTESRAKSGKGTYQPVDLSVIREGSTDNVNTVIPQSDPEPKERKVYGTVKATVHVFKKSLTSRGVLDFKIIDAYSQRVLSQEKMPGEFVWFTEWGYFNGDERALDDYYLEVVKSKEAYPPPPQDLFVAFTQPIFGQVTTKINNFYRGY